MIATSSYLRTNYLKTAAATDTVLNELMVIVQGDIRDIIQQPVEEENVTWYFEGRPGYYRQLLYTLKPVLVSLQERIDVGGSWTTIAGAAIENGEIYHPDGYVEGRPYRVTCTVGLVSAEVDSKSADFNTGMYGPILRVAAEMLTVRLQESNHTNAGESRLGVSQIATGFQGDTVTKAIKDLMPSWREALKPYRVRRTF